ncbi:hypothetical protein STEG23_018023, partial [Scotinomys teguina]
TESRMCQLSWFLDPGGWSKTAAVGLYFIFPGICTLSLCAHNHQSFWSFDSETQDASQSRSQVFITTTELLSLLIYSSCSPGEHSAARAKKGISKGHISILVLDFLTCNTVECTQTLSKASRSYSALVLMIQLFPSGFFRHDFWDFSDFLTLRKMKKRLCSVLLLQNASL